MPCAINWIGNRNPPGLWLWILESIKKSLAIDSTIASHYGWNRPNLGPRGQTSRQFLFLAGRVHCQKKRLLTTSMMVPYDEKRKLTWPIQKTWNKTREVIWNFCDIQSQLDLDVLIWMNTGYYSNQHGNKIHHSLVLCYNIPAWCSSPSLAPCTAFRGAWLQFLL